MATEDTLDKPRRSFGPRAIGSLVPTITRPAFRTRAPASTQVMADWALIVGPALAEATSPRRLTSGTLVLACSGPVALELQHLTGPLMERINAHLGRVVVERLRFVQDAGAPAPPRQAARRARPAPVDVPGIAPGPLRDALAALGAALGQEPSGDPA